MSVSLQCVDQKSELDLCLTKEWEKRSSKLRCLLSVNLQIASRLCNHCYWTFFQVEAKLEKNSTCQKLAENKEN